MDSGVTDHIFLLGEITVARSQYLGDEYYYVFSSEKCIFKVRRGQPVLERLQLLLPRLFRPKKQKAPWSIERVMGMLGILTVHADDIVEIEQEANIVKTITSKYLCEGRYNVHLHLYLTAQERQPGEIAGSQHEPTLDYFLLNVGHTTHSGPWLIESLPPLAANKVLSISAKTDGTQDALVTSYMDEDTAENWWLDHDKCRVNQTSTKKFKKLDGVKVFLAIDIAQAYIAHLKDEQN